MKKELPIDVKEFEGIDADIETSLKEYGLAWVEDDKYYYVWYGCEYNEKDGYIRFSSSTIGKDEDISEYNPDNDDFSNVIEYVGTTEKEWDDHSFMIKIEILVSYHGAYDILGSPCTGYTYEELVKETT